MVVVHGGGSGGTGGDDHDDDDDYDNVVCHNIVNETIKLT